MHADPHKRKNTCINIFILIREACIIVLGNGTLAINGVIIEYHSIQGKEAHSMASSLKTV